MNTIEQAKLIEVLESQLEQSMEKTMNKTELELAFELSNNSIYSGLYNKLHKAGELEMPEAMIVAGAMMENMLLLIDEDPRWSDMMEEMMYEGTIEIQGIEGRHTGEDVDYMKALVKADLVSFNDSHIIGDALYEMMTKVKRAYRPNLITEGITRRFNYSRTHCSDLFKEAIGYLEASPYTVDDRALRVALQVSDQLPEKHKIKQQNYMLLGAQQMDSNLAYISEYKGDDRLRINQCALHGPSGQNSDMARSIENYHGVDMDYNPENAMNTLVVEMKDMGKWESKAQFMDDVICASEHPVEFIMKHVNKDKHIDKPFTFAKAAHIMVELRAHIQGHGDKPYIGMGFGKDAKCSGPQLGALMTNDMKVAAACGMTMQEQDDAYELCIIALKEHGFEVKERSHIKKAYMGIFYGQGAGAFCNQKAYEDGDIHQELWAAIHPHNVTEDRAKLFHAIVEKSFGKNMQALRRKIRNMGVGYDENFEMFIKANKPVRHTMPDGSVVAMNYKVRENILGESLLDPETLIPNVSIEVGNFSMFLKQPTIKTDEYNHSDFARNGFVNMIQATDAMVARLIVVKLGRLGVKHITSIHDCFRVSVNDQAKLDEAIKWAYMSLFGTTTNEVTEDLPLGTDIIGMYFKGAEDALKESYKGSIKHNSQFTMKSGLRVAYKVDRKHTLVECIEALGTSYYFDK